jgi:hypothetical protein
MVIWCHVGLCQAQGTAAVAVTQPAALNSASCKVAICIIGTNVACVAVIADAKTAVKTISLAGVSAFRQQSGNR